MQNALKTTTAALFVLTGLAGCQNKQSEQNAAVDANVIAIDNDAATPGQVEALPPDESSETPSNQLVNGDDSPDVNADNATNSD